MRQVGKSGSSLAGGALGARWTGVLLVGSIASPCLAQATEAAPAVQGDVTVSSDQAVTSEATAATEVPVAADPSQTSQAGATAPNEAAASTATPTTEAASVPAYAGLRAQEGYYDAASGPAAYPYLSRYKPTNNQWEVTLYLGALFPSVKHNLKVPELPVDEYSKAAVQLGFRVGYFPLPYVGAEVQSFVGGGSLRDSGRSAVFYGLSGHLVGQLPLASVVPFVTVGVGALGAVSETMGHDRDPAFIWGLGVKAALNKRVNARFDFQDTMSQKRDAKNGSQTHHPAIQLGVSFVFEREVKRIPRLDVDYDGLFDADDKCKSEGALTFDGCPIVVDTDGDGVFDPEDKCPLEAGTQADGCPNLDIDGDHVLLPQDQCPDEVGEAPSGCPNLDPDADGLSGDADKCPTEAETKNGYEDRDGCPDEMPEAVKSFTGVIQGIRFTQGTALIDKSSHPTLDSAAKILADYPTIQIEVSGHTSSEGSEERNQTLSVQRAEAVRRYFLDKGVEPDRVVARGAGATEPIADNATRGGREQNRRIEFRVLSQP